KLPLSDCDLRIAAWAASQFNNHSWKEVNRRLDTNGVDWTVTKKTLRFLEGIVPGFEPQVWEAIAKHNAGPLPVSSAELSRLANDQLVFVPGESKKNEKTIQHVKDRVIYNGVAGRINNETIRSLDGAGLSEVSDVVLSRMYEDYLKVHPNGVDFETWKKRR